MAAAFLAPADPKLDLVLERVVDVPCELVWAAWTTPEHLKQWFCPLPWKTIECEIDLRPGGAFYTVMQSPDGQKFPNTGCYLEVTPGCRLVWTSMLGPGFRPQGEGPEGPENSCGPAMTAIVAMEPHGAGTKYTATALHKNEAARQAHADMGFHDGWGTALDQLVASIKKMQAAG